MRAERTRETNIKAYAHARWRTAGQHLLGELHEHGRNAGDCRPK